MRENAFKNSAWKNGAIFLSLNVLGFVGNKYFNL